MQRNVPVNMEYYHGGSANMERISCSEALVIALGRSKNMPRRGCMLMGR